MKVILDLHERITPIELVKAVRQTEKHIGCKKKHLP